MTCSPPTGWMRLGATHRLRWAALSDISFFPLARLWPPLWRMRQSQVKTSFGLVRSPESAVGTEKSKNSSASCVAEKRSCWCCTPFLDWLFARISTCTHVLPRLQRHFPSLPVAAVFPLEFGPTNVRQESEGECRLLHTTSLLPRPPTPTSLFLYPSKRTTLLTIRHQSLPYRRLWISGDNRLDCHLHS